jgi:hypothetical protein
MRGDIIAAVAATSKGEQRFDYLQHSVPGSSSATMPSTSQRLPSQGVTAASSARFRVAESGEWRISADGSIHARCGDLETGHQDHTIGLPRDEVEKLLVRMRSTTQQ